MALLITLIILVPFGGTCCARLAGPQRRLFGAGLAVLSLAASLLVCRVFDLGPVLAGDALLAALAGLVGPELLVWLRRQWLWAGGAAVALWLAFNPGLLDAVVGISLLYVMLATKFVFRWSA